MTPVVKKAEVGKRGLEDGAAVTEVVITLMVPTHSFDVLTRYAFHEMAPQQVLVDVLNAVIKDDLFAAVLDR